MSHISVDVTREGRHWRISCYIDGEIKPTTVFGCNEGIEPVLSGLLAAEAKQHAAFTAPKATVRGLPATITFHLPGERAVTYAIITPQEPLTNRPELLAVAIGSRTTGDPVNGG